MRFHTRQKREQKFYGKPSGASIRTPILLVYESKDGLYREASLSTLTITYYSVVAYVVMLSLVILLFLEKIASFIISHLLRSVVQELVTNDHKVM